MHVMALSEPKRVHLAVDYNTFKFWWVKGDRSKALQSLRNFIDVDLKDAVDPETKLLKVKSLLKCAEWMRASRDYSPEETCDIVKAAQAINPDYYWVWHAWATVNFARIQQFDSDNTNRGSLDNGGTTSASGNTSPSKQKSQVGSVPKLNKSQIGRATPIINEAIEGFINSILLGSDQPIAYILEDILRLLTLLFKYAPDIIGKKSLKDKMDRISADYWLKVIPQLIARMHMKGNLYNTLKMLLVKLANEHPQALVCPILVAINTTDVQQLKIAREIRDIIRSNDRSLVDEAKVMSRELMKVAITPHEFWQQGLEKPAQLLKEQEIKSMVEKLLELHASMDEKTVGFQKDDEEGFTSSVGRIGWENIRDISFRHCYGRDISDAYRWLVSFQRSNNLFDLHQAWDIYRKIHARISQQLKSMKKIDLGHISQGLLAKNTFFNRLVVPGTYDERNVITIKRFVNTVEVISSKQRPRKITILGSDGQR
jgi:FKBP12-rapamycin complex-associated protein